jgi:hypothetical protein
MRGVGRRSYAERAEGVRSHKAGGVRIHNLCVVTAQTPELLLHWHGMQGHTKPLLNVPTSLTQ